MLFLKFITKLAVVLFVLAVMQSTPSYAQTSGCSALSGSTHTFTTSPTAGNISQGALNGTFSSVVSFGLGDFSGIGSTDGAEGIQFNLLSKAGTLPDSYQVDYAVTPDSQSQVESVVVCQSTYENSAGNDEPNELTVTWDGTGTATIIDPAGQITSHADGDTIISGTTLTFIDSIANGGPGNFGGGLDGPDQWGILIYAAGSITPFNVSIFSIGCPTPGGGFCSATTTGSNTSGSRFQEWISLNATLALQNPSLEITKTADQPDLNANVPVGTVIIYTYVVRNNGNQTISNISLDDVSNGSGGDPVPALVPNNPTTDVSPLSDSQDNSADQVWDALAPGDEITFIGTYTVTQSDIDTLQ